MIISKTPYRISFFGGGSDYPNWFNKFTGQVLSTTINKHIYITCRFLPKFFKHITDKYTKFSEFQEYNKLYCAVSGSLISPGSKPEFINIKEDVTSKNICGYYYKCCWPCVCDLMKYAKVTKITKKFQEGSKDIYALVIDNPCPKKDFPKKVNRSYFCDGNDLDKKQISTHNGKLIIGLLYDAKYCQPSDLRKIYSNSITGRLCPIRNSTPLSEISSGMGDIFIKLAR